MRNKSGDMRVTSLKMDGNGNKCLDHSTLNAFLGRNEEIDHIKSNINKTQSKNAKIFIVTVFFFTLHCIAGCE